IGVEARENLRNIMTASKKTDSVENMKVAGKMPKRRLLFPVAYDDAPGRRDIAPQLGEGSNQKGVILLGSQPSNRPDDPRIRGKIQPTSIQEAVRGSEAFELNAILDGEGA